MDDMYQKLDSRMNIEIVSVALAHPPMLSDILQRLAMQYRDSARRVTITCREPERDGSLMYIVHIEYLGGSSLTVGALRRTLDAQTEYHS